MRWTLALAGLVLFQGLALAQTLAQTPEKRHYAGEMKLSTATGEPIGSQVVLLEKTLDRASSTITERVIVVHAEGKVDASTMVLAVKDDNTFTLTGDTRQVEGAGTLFGPAWRWTLLKGTFKARNGVIVEDEDFMPSEHVITARKKVIAPENDQVFYQDMSVRAITPRTFEILQAALLRK